MNIYIYIFCIGSIINDSLFIRDVYLFNTVSDIQEITNMYHRNSLGI